MWGVKLVAVVVGLLVMVPDTMQLTQDHPLHSVVERVNLNAGPFLGLVLSSKSSEKSLLESGSFVPSTSTPLVVISGRKFNIGEFNGVPAIYVLSGSPLTAVGVTVQILLDTFRIRGVIHYGTSATVSDKVAIGDVAVLGAVGFTSAWTWQNYESGLGAFNATLKIGNYNLPTAGENSLGSLDLQRVTRYTPTSSKKTVYWFPIPQNWFQIASSSLKNVELDKCVDVGVSVCQSEEPSIVYGVRGSSADIYLLNEAYGKFLNDKLDVSTVDTASAAVVSTAIANGVPHIVFRAPSNKPGVSKTDVSTALANKNLLKVVAAFVESITPTPYSNYY